MCVENLLSNQMAWTSSAFKSNSTRQSYQKYFLVTLGVSSFKFNRACVLIVANEQNFCIKKSLWMPFFNC